MRQLCVLEVVGQPWDIAASQARTALGDCDAWWGGSEGATSKTASVQEGRSIRTRSRPSSAGGRYLPYLDIVGIQGKLSAQAPLHDSDCCGLGIVDHPRLLALVSG